MRGEFASGLSVNEGPFEEWIANERHRISDLAISALERLIQHYEDQRDADKAAVIARKLLFIDPLHERVHQSLMRALAHQERFESALQQYKTCQDLLRKELNIVPSDETVSLRDEIARRRETVRHIQTAPAVETKGLIRAIRGKPAKEIVPGSNFPPQLQGLDLTVPERPSMVILPFSNLTGDANYDHLAEGIRIDVQAALVKITGIFLIAAGSANAMRGRDTQSAGQGVRRSLCRSGQRAEIRFKLAHFGGINRCPDAKCDLDGNL